VLTDRTIELLATRGYDSRLGACLLRRVMLCYRKGCCPKKLLVGQINPSQQIELDTPEPHQALEVR